MINNNPQVKIDIKSEFKVTDAPPGPMLANFNVKDGFVVDDRGKQMRPATKEEISPRRGGPEF